MMAFRFWLTSFCLFSFLSLSLLLTSCQNHDEESKRLRLTLASEPPTLDWNTATDGVSYQVLNQLMEGLAQYDNQLNVVPAIASHWKISDDGTTYTFYLNPEYRWSDQKPVRAQDFYESWIRLLDPQTASEYAYFLFDIVGAKDFNAGKLSREAVGLRVVDERTFEVRLVKPLVYFPALTTFMVTFPIRKDLIDQSPSDWTSPKKLVTCGPYVLKEWQHDYRLQLTANPYFGGHPKPQISEILFYIVSDAATAAFLFESGHIDVSPVPALALEKYRHQKEFLSLPKLRGYYLGFNVNKEPVNRVEVRRAMAASLNKSLLPEILKGEELPVNSWVPPGMFGYAPDIGVEQTTQSNQHIKNVAPITLAFNSDSTNKKVAEWAQAQWNKNLGLEVKLHTMEWKSYLAEINNNPPAIFRLGWGADYPDPDNFLNLFTSNSGNNHTGWRNQEYDDLIKKGSSEPSVEKRKKIYDRAQKILLEEEVVIIPLFIPRQNLLVREKFKPYPLLPLDISYLKRVVMTSVPEG